MKINTADEIKEWTLFLNKAVCSVYGVFHQLAKDYTICGSVRRWR